jgi:hypothetical protein
VRVQVGTPEGNRVAGVYLDGELLRYVQEADTDEGWVDQLVVPPARRPEDDNWVTTRRYGLVIITFREDT